MAGSGSKNSNVDIEVNSTSTTTMACNKPVYVGSNLHFSCGLEVAELVWLKKEFSLYGTKQLFSDVARAGTSACASEQNIKDNEVRGGIRQVTSKEKTGTLHLARARAGARRSLSGIWN